MLLFRLWKKGIEGKERTFIIKWLVENHWRLLVRIWSVIQEMNSDIWISKRETVNCWIKRILYNSNLKIKWNNSFHAPHLISSSYSSVNFTYPILVVLMSWACIAWLPWEFHEDLKLSQVFERNLTKCYCSRWLLSFGIKKTQNELSKCFILQLINNNQIAIVL